MYVKIQVNVEIRSGETPVLFFWLTTVSLRKKRGGSLRQIQMLFTQPRVDSGLMPTRKKHEQVGD